MPAYLPGLQFPIYSGWTNFTPTIPKMYWDAYSQEQIIKELCKNFAKVEDYLDYVAELMNEWNLEFSEDMNAQFKRIWTAINEGFEEEAEKWIRENFENIFNDFTEQINNETRAREESDNGLSNEIIELNTRVDNIASLPEGSTSGDAELIDVRLAYNNIIYPNAGTAVRKQIEEAINDAKTRDSEFLVYQDFDITVQGGVGISSDIDVYANIPLYIVVKEYSNAPFINIYSSADTAPYVVSAVGKGCYTLIPLNDGKLRFYAESYGTIKGYVYAKNRLDSIVPGENSLLFNSNIISYNQFYGSRIMSGATKRHIGKTFNFAGIAHKNCNINNYEQFLVNGGPTCTSPIKIRNIDKTLLYSNVIYTHEIDFAPDGGTGLVTFDIDGYFLREVRLPQLITREEIFEEDEYYAMFFEYPNVYPNNLWYADNLNISNECRVYNITDTNIITDSYLYNCVPIIKSKNINFGTAQYNATVNNYIPYLTNSGAGNLSVPIRLRNYDGSLVYKSFKLENATSQDSVDPAMVWLFGADGKLLRYLTRKQWLQRNEIFFEDEYYGMFMEWNGFAWKWKVNATGLNKIYNVGVYGDWQTFTDMLVALKDDKSEKTVIIEPGQYDIFEEMGGYEYMQSITNPENLNWRDVCNIVPTNTHIIGVGDVWLNWMPTSEEIISQAHAILFSPLNVSGTCTIENIKLKMRNGRYTIHDETSGQAQYDGAEHIYKNVEAYMIEEGHTYGNHCAFGCGHNGNMHFVFENCRFSSYVEDVWWCHDWIIPQANSTLFEFNNTIFLVDGEPAQPRFNTDTVENNRMDTAKFNGCVMSGVRHSTTTGKTKQICKVIAMLCNELTETATGGIVISIPIEQYLIIN